MIRLAPLTAEEMLVLCEKLADMHAGLYGYERKIGAAELARFIRLEYGRIGADQNLTPREAIRDFIELLDLLYQNPALHMDELLQVGRLHLCPFRSRFRPDRQKLCGVYNMMDVFQRYAPFIQDYIYRSGWQTLRGVQNAAGEAIFGTEDNVLLTASTASGKTEAAFFPILTLLDENPSDSVGVLYIAPLKALINDQFERLDDLCREAGISVTRWHGDAPRTQKRKLLKKPSGILQITPESLESPDDQQTYGDSFSVRRSAFSCHRRDSLPASRRPGNADLLPDRTALHNGGVQPEKDRTLRNHRKSRSGGTFSLRRQRTQNHHSPV